MKVGIESLVGKTISRAGQMADLKTGESVVYIEFDDGSTLTVTSETYEAFVGDEVQA